jgi:hypothetical protein
VNPGARAFFGYQVSPGVAGGAESGLESPLGEVVGEAIPLVQPGSQAQTPVADEQEQLHEQLPQAGQQGQQAFLEVEETVLVALGEDDVDDLVEAVVGLTAQLVNGGWTARGRWANLREAHGVVSGPVQQDTSNGQDRPQEPFL